MNTTTIDHILCSYPGVQLIAARNRRLIILFFVKYLYQRSPISESLLEMQLADFLVIARDQEMILEQEDKDQIRIYTDEEKAKKYIQKWTNNGYLSSHHNQEGIIHYTLSSDTQKTLDWLYSLEKKEYVGAESKFKTIFQQLQELVEFTNEDVSQRIELLEDKKMNIEQQIQQLQAGEKVELFEEYQIVPRFQELTRNAKELLSDFKEVKDNFRTITKEIYDKHADESLQKKDILAFTFDALDELKDSHQGKSFYAFWNFLLSKELQKDWEQAIDQLYDTFRDKALPIKDHTLQNIKSQLYQAARQVNNANDKMADKLSRIIRENAATKARSTQKLTQAIKQLLLKISQQKYAAKLERLSLHIDSRIQIAIPFERKLTLEPKKQTTFAHISSTAVDDASISSHQLSKLIQQNVFFDKKQARHRIKQALQTQSQCTLAELIRLNGGIQKGLVELMGYFSLLKEFKHDINENKTENIIFDLEQQKALQIPEIIISR